MNTVSAYVFRQALGPLLAILGGLAAIAILTQGLNQLDIIITNRRAGFAFAWVTLLALPQLLSLILPMALFIAVGSFFLGQSQVFSLGIRQSGVLVLPVALVALTLAYWMGRYWLGGLFSRRQPLQELG